MWWWWWYGGDGGDSNGEWRWCDGGGGGDGGNGSDGGYGGGAAAADGEGGEGGEGDGDCDAAGDGISDGDGDTTTTVLSVYDGGVGSLMVWQRDSDDVGGGNGMCAVVVSGVWWCIRRVIQRCGMTDGVDLLGGFGAEIEGGNLDVQRGSGFFATSEQLQL